MFFEIIVLAFIFGAGYFIGKNLKNVPKLPPKSKGGYSAANHQDLENYDENEMNLIRTKQYFAKDDYEDNQKEIDKLMQEINELKKKEKKYQAEIQILKTQLKNKTTTTTATPTPDEGTQKKKEYANKDLDDLINDQEMNNLIGSTKVETNELIDTDKLLEEIDDE